MTTKKIPEPTKFISIHVPVTLARKIKILAELTGTTMSDLMADQMEKVVRAKLPKALAGLDDNPENPVAAE